MATRNDLKNIAKDKKIKKYHTLTKEDLSQRLGIPIFFSKKYYENIAEERGLQNYKSLKKADLIKLLNIWPEIPEKPIPAPRLKKRDISENPILAPKTKKSDISEKTIPAQRLKKSDISEKPIPAPRLKKSDISERPIPAPRILLNIKNPEINVPVLQPEIAIVKEKEAPTVIKKTTETVLGWMDWLKESGKKIIKPVSDFLKNLKEKINAIFEKENEFVARDGQSALSHFTREKIIDGRPGYEPKRFFKAVRNLLIKILQENKNTKTKMIFICQMQRTDLKTDETIDVEAEFHSEIEKNLEETNDKKLLDRMIARIEEVLANFQQSGSNWVFQQIIRLEIHFANWQPLGGSTFIPLPAKIKNKKGVINLKNEDNQCFKWCIVRALNPVDKNPNRINKELIEQAKSLNWNGLKFPVDLKQIKIFENNNASISINVFGYEDEVYPLKISKDKKIINIDLLLISVEEKQHYCLINNLSRFIRSSLTKHHETVEICRSCLNYFPDKNKLKNHEDYCFQNETVKIEMPPEGSAISFMHHNRAIKVPFVIYADFEAFTKEIQPIPQNDQVAFTQKYQHHQPSGFCYKIVGQNIKRCALFRAKDKNEDVSKQFVEMLEEDIKKIFKQFKFAKKMLPLTKKKQTEFENAKICWICQKGFEKKDKKVRDHDHFTGKFRGAAHNQCNLQFKKPKFTPVIFHNLSGYDAHLFVKNLGKSEGNIKCIPNNEEKYISFSKEIIVDAYEKDGKKVEVKHEIRFLDSFKFMASSLDSLAGNLDLSKFIQTKKEFGKKYELMTKKGIYPYDYMNGFEKFSERQLPPKQDFYSKLNDCGITDKEYEHAEIIWKEFEIKNLGEYHDLYLKSDVLLLADVFEEFRNICLENYSLDPACYYTSPGLSWDALLKHSKVNLELLSDPDMLLMFEKGIRGGIFHDFKSFWASQ